MPTFQGATIQKAIDAGLSSLGVLRAQVSVEVVQEGKKGFLGFGRKPAIVNLQVETIGAPPATSAETPTQPPVTEKSHREQRAPKRDDQTAIALVQSYLEDVTRAMGLTTSITSSRRGGQVWFAIETNQEAQLIGKHGKIINALQYLAQTEFNHHGKSSWTVMLNVGDYRQRRDATVRRLGEKTAREVIARGSAVYLDPMPAFERKAIHAALGDNPYVETHSEGRDPRRYIVVTPTGHRS